MYVTKQPADNHMYRTKQPADLAEFRERENDTMFAALVRFIQEWKRYNQSLNELSRLGDRELADIGISRSDIASVAWKSAHRD